MSIVKEATSKLRYALLIIDFGIDNRFYKSEELETFCQRTRMPDYFTKFLRDLKNTKKESFSHSYCSTEVKNNYQEDENIGYDLENTIAKENFKLSLSFYLLDSALHYSAREGNYTTPYHKYNGNFW